MPSKKYGVDLDLNGRQLLNATLHNTTTLNAEGRVGYDSTAKRVVYHNGTGTKTLVESGGIVDNDINSTANISWLKISKTGSSLADLAIRSASDLNSGTLPLDRLSGITSAQLAANANIASSQIDPLERGSTGAGLLAQFDGNNRLQGADPADATDYATKQYVDSMSQGLRQFKDPVRAVVTALPASTMFNGVITASANGAWSSADSDSVNLAPGDRVAVIIGLTAPDTNPTPDLRNGIYTVTQLGDVNSPWVLTRAEDMNAYSEVKAGQYLLVTEGNTFADVGMVLTTDGTISLSMDGTTGTPLKYVPFHRLQDIVAGVGLVKSGNSLSHATSGITAGNYIGFSVNEYGHIISFTQPTTLQQYGITDGVKKATVFEIQGDGTTTEFVVNHNLGTRDVTVTVREAFGSYEYPVVGIVAGTDQTNQVKIQFSAAPAMGENYRVMVAAF